MPYINNEASYDKISDDWQKFRNKTEVNKCIVEFTQLIKPGGRILDIGCGTGRPIAEFLSLSGFCVTGIDISNEMIKKARAANLENASFLKQDIMDYSTDIKYDGIIAFDSLWHIAKNRQPHIYGKISSLMNNNAYFLFTHGNRNNETEGTMFGQPFYYGALSACEVHTLLKRAGLKIISAIENYKEKTTGERDLLVVAKKPSQSKAIKNARCDMSQIFAKKSFDYKIIFII